jgi:hypothetical protein
MFKNTIFHINLGKASVLLVLMTIVFVALYFLLGCSKIEALGLSLFIIIIVGIMTNAMVPGSCK